MLRVKWTVRAGALACCLRGFGVTDPAEVQSESAGLKCSSDGKLCPPTELSARPHMHMQSSDSRTGARVSRTVAPDVK